MTCRISLQKQTTLIVSALILAAPASLADRRQPAPIEYVGQGSVPRANTNATNDAWRGPVTTSGPVAPPSARVQLDFAYPGSPKPSASTARPQMASVERSPSLAQPRSSAAAWPLDTAPAAQPAAAPSGPKSLMLGASPRNTALTPQQSEPVTPRFVSATPAERGLASWYGEDFHGNPTANGETFDMYAMSAAHRTLPLPSLVQVINEANGKEVVVRVNDRGPFEDGRIIDLSQRAAEALDIVDLGTAPVTVKYLGPAPEAQVSPLSFAEAERPAPRIVQAEPEPTPQPRTNLYGEYLMGGVEPSLGVPDPGQSVATPARLAAATPAPATPRTLVPADVQQASLPAVQAAPAMTQPAPIQAAVTPPTGQYSANAFSPKIFVQIGAFADISNAEGMNAQVGRQYPVDIEPVRVGGADYFRVLVGPFPSRDAADLAKYQLGARGIKDGFIVLR